MTERTHDLAALTALTLVIIAFTVPPMTIGTLVTALLANQIGSAVPDLDQSTAEFYRELPVGSIVGKVMAPLMGGHRFISHSLVGMGLIGWGVHALLGLINTFLIVDMDIIWWAFMLGYLSHLIMDTLTKDGVPWLFPIPIKFGFPPFRFLRVKTGQLMENFGVYPLLLIMNGYLVYSHYSQFSYFFRELLIK